MTRMVYCQYLKREAPGLDTPPHPGELGMQVFDNISAEAWNQWLNQLTMLINENRLSTADEGSLKVIEQHMEAFLFQGGALGQLPAGFAPPGGKK